MKMISGLLAIGLGICIVGVHNTFVEAAELNGTSLKSLYQVRAYYRFENGALTTDDSSNDHTLTALSDPAEDASGKYGGCVVFDGNDAYSHADDAHFKPTGNFSFGCWFKTATTNTQMGLMQSASTNLPCAGIELIIGTDNKVTFSAGKNTGQVENTDVAYATSAGTVTNGNWHLAVATWDGTHMTLYIDNNAAVEKDWANAPAYAATNYIRIGCRNITGANIAFLTGSIDDAFVLNGRALTAAQVSILYSSTAQTLTLQPDATTGVDTFIRSSAADTNYATSNEIDVGEEKGAAAVYRELIKFDLSSFASVDTIKSAVLELQYKNAGSDYASNNRTMRIYRARRAWTEEGATWNHYAGTTDWGTAGCYNVSTDLETTEVGSIALATTDGADWKRNAILSTTVLQTMIPGGAWTNNGFVFAMDTETDDLYIFYSSDAATVESRPKLVIDYEPGNLPPTAFSLLSPSDQTSTNDNTPTLSWGISSDPESQTITYTLKLSTTAGFTEPVYRTVSGLNVTNYTPGAGEPIADDGYYWRVIASDGETETASAAWQLTVDTQNPVAPAISTVVQDVTTGKITSIAGTGENGTTLTFHARSGGTIAGTTDWAGGTFTFTPTTPLDSGSVVYVQSQDGASNSSQSRTHMVMFEDYMDIFKADDVYHGPVPGNSMRLEKDTSCEFDFAVNAGSPVTVRAWLMYNSEYDGSLADAPVITLSGPGITTGNTAAMTAPASYTPGTWEELTVSGTPNAKGVVTLTVETSSTADGAKTWVDDISVTQ